MIKKFVKDENLTLSEKGKEALLNVSKELLFNKEKI